MLMYKEEGGFRNVHEGEIVSATEQGWIDGQKVWDERMAKKVKRVVEPIAIPEEPVIIAVQPALRRAGRPRKGISPSPMSGDDGNRTDTY